MNILYKDISSNQFLTSDDKIPIRPQYSGDLLWRGSNINPTTGNIQTSNNLGPVYDPSGAVYNIPIHWRAKCIIPKPSQSSSQYINWNGTLDSALDPSGNGNATIYIALTMFNTQPQFALNLRTFNYKVILSPLNDNPTIGTGIQSAPGQNPDNYGYSNWSNRSGFTPNMSISTL